MVTKNVTKRASKAMHEISLANEHLQSLFYVLQREDNLQTLFASIEHLDEAQKELVKILAQDNKVDEL